MSLSGSNQPLVTRPINVIDVNTAFLPPHEIVKVVEKAGVTKANLPLAKMVVLALLAGAYIGFGGMVGISLSKGCTLAEPGVSKLMLGCVGLIIIVISGGELANGNFGIIFPAFLSKKISFIKMIRAWTVVYSANVVGCLLSAYFLAYTPGLFAAEPYVSGVQKIAIGKTSGKTFFQTFLLGVGSNWLVNLACYMAIASKTVSSKIIALWLPTFATIGFEHGIANSFLIPLGILYGANISLWQLIFNNLIPVTLGNIVSATCFVGLPYWYCYVRSVPGTDIKKSDVENVNK